MMSNAFIWKIAYLECMHSLIRLRHIVAVARSGSFSIAAEEVGISQPALSRSIQAFEDDYGLRLFDRGKGGVTLTPAGALAVEQARAMLVSANAFDRSMRQFGKGGAGRTGVGMGPMMASLLLPRLGVSLMQSSPGLTLVTRIGPPEGMLEALLDGTIELIVGNSWQTSLVPGVSEEDLGAISLAIVARAQHPLADVPGLGVAQVEHYPSARPYDHVGQSGASGAFVCENHSILRETVLHSDCTWLVSPALVRADLEDGSLVTLDIADRPVADTRISLLHARGRTRSPASVRIADEIRAMVKALENPA